MKSILKKYYYPVFALLLIVSMAILASCGLPGDPVDECYITDGYFTNLYVGGVPVVPGGVTTFLGLTDTPANYVGEGGNYVRVNAGETALEFNAVAGGDVVGPAGATDHAIARFDTNTGKLLQNSVVTISDLGNILTAGDINGFDINAANDVNVTNDLDVTDDADIGGDLSVVGDAEIDGLLTTPTGRTATYVVAASDAPTHVIAQADYVCDGTADDVEIQAAIDALTVGRTHKETIKLTGKFNISSVISVPSYTVIDMSEALIYLTSGSNCEIFNNATSPVYYVDVFGGEINGNKTGNTAGAAEGAIGISAAYSNFTNVYIHDFAGTGIYCGRSIYVNTNFNIIKDCTNGGITQDTDDYGEIKGNYIYKCATAGGKSSIIVKDHKLVDGNIIIDGGANCQIFGTEYDTITNNELANGDGMGIAYFKYSLVANNTIYNVAKNAIDSGGDGYNTITGNTIDTVTATGGTGAGITNTHDSTITGNTIKNTAYAGIYVCPGENNLVISGNTMDTCGTTSDAAGIYITTTATTTSNILITGNLITGSTWGVKQRADGGDISEITVTSNDFRGVTTGVDFIFSNQSSCIVNLNQGYIAPSEVRTASGTLTAGNANAICFSWHNPEGQDILVKKVVVEVTTAGGTPGSHLDVGIADDAAGTNRGTEFFDDLDLNATQINDSWVAGDGGTQTKWVFCQDNASATDGWVVGQILDANAANLVGRWYIIYVGR